MASGAMLEEDCEPEKLSEEMQARLRYLQIEAVLTQTPQAMAANLVCAGAMCALFWDHPYHVALFIWSALIVVAAAFGMLGWSRYRRRSQTDRPKMASARTIRRAVQHAAILGTLWGLPPVVFAPDASWEQRLVLTAISAGMICTGAFSLSTVERAGTAFAVAVGLGSALALRRADFSLAFGLMLLLAMCVWIIVRSVRGASNTFTARFLAEVKAERQKQVISRLLREFESQAADLLWEVNEVGALRHVSQRLAQVLHSSPEDLEGLRLVEVLEARQQALAHPLKEEAAQQLAQLEAALALGKPFRDLEVPFFAAKDAVWLSFTGRPLDRTGTGWRGVVSNVTRAREAQHGMWLLSHVDGVTGLANRHHFHAELGAALESIQEEGSDACAVLLVDLDQFKKVNDAFGHDVGDKILKIVGQRLTGAKRAGDVLARLGGDEFALIVREAHSEDQLMRVAVRLSRSLTRPCDIDGITVSVSGSIGVAIAGSPGMSPGTLLKHADLALYAAKDERPAQIRFYEHSMTARMLQQVAMERHLRDAIPKKQLRLMYQPQQQLASSQVVGFEALVRWHHPELGNVSPAQFIPVAEESDLILEIGSWVLREACRQASTWPENLSVAVNLSVRQIIAQDLRAEVSAALSASGLAPSRLHVEVTESVLLKEGDTSLAKLHELRSMGVSIALDDFGTGYSAMAYLRRFSFDKLKIDRAFVTQIASQADGRAIVRAIIEMAHALKMETIAEGVEEREELEILRSQNCDAVQGYFVAKPMEADAIVAFIADHREEPLNGAVLSG